MKKADIILIGVVLVAAIVALLYFMLKPKETGAVVQIVVENKLYKEADLATDQTITFDENGEKNVVTISKGNVFMETANCPDKICVKHSPIHYAGEQIVCLPHKLIVQIKGGEQSALDAQLR